MSPRVRILQTMGAEEPFMPPAGSRPEARGSKEQVGLVEGIPIG